MRVKKPDKLLRACGLALLILTLTTALTSAATLVNGGFETGDFTGWTVNAVVAGTPVDIALHPQNTAETAYVHVEVNNALAYYAPAGNLFALLKAGEPAVVTQVSRQTIAITPGTWVGCFAFFDTAYTGFAPGGGSNDKGWVDVIGPDLVRHHLFQASAASVAPSGYTGWQAVSFNANVAGIYTIEAGVVNTDGGLLDSYLGLDQCNYGNATPVSLSDFAVSQREGKVMVEWQTGVELNHAGFNVLRATSPNGDFKKINASLVGAKDAAVSGATYRFEDRPGYGTYWYKLEAVATDGSKETWPAKSIKVESGYRLPSQQPTPPAGQ